MTSLADMQTMTMSKAEISRQFGVDVSRLDPTGTYELATEINDAYRRARLNVKYYGCRLAELQRNSMIIDIAIAIGTSGTIASMAIWKYEAGKVVFAVIAGVSAILGVAKPILRLPENISRCSKLWASYNGAHTTLERAARDMKLNGGIRVDVAQAARAAIESMEGLANNEDAAPRRKLIERCDAQVRDEIPADARDAQKFDAEILLGDRDRDAFLAATENPPEASSKILAAAQRYKKMRAEGNLRTDAI